MARVISALALLSVFLFNGCSIDYDVAERIGGDVAGFSIPDYATRFYSGENGELTLQSAGDTLIENQNFKAVYYGYEMRYFLYTEQYLYERFEFSGMQVTVPFINQILIEGLKDYRKYEGDLYSYIYRFRVDSLGSITEGERNFENVYFVTASVNISTSDKDTSFSNIFLITHTDGIIGIEDNSSLLYLDSIIVY